MNILKVQTVLNNKIYKNKQINFFYFEFLKLGFFLIKALAKIYKLSHIIH